MITSPILSTIMDVCFFTTDLSTVFSKIAFVKHACDSGMKYRILLEGGINILHTFMAYGRLIKLLNAASRGFWSRACVCVCVSAMAKSSLRLQNDFSF